MNSPYLSVSGLLNGWLRQRQENKTPSMIKQIPIAPTKHRMAIKTGDGFASIVSSGLSW